MGWPNYAEVGNGDCLTVARALPCPVRCVGGQGRRVLPHRPMLAQRNASAPAKRAETTDSSSGSIPALRRRVCAVSMTIRLRSKSFAIM
jgi:hypothetical protein